MANFPNYPTYPAQGPQGSQQGGFYPSYINGYQQLQMPAQAPQAAPSGFVCKPVTSREEAIAITVDFFGPGTLMPDLAHGMIYFKRFNQQTGGSFNLLGRAWCAPNNALTAIDGTAPAAATGGGDGA